VSQFAGQPPLQAGGMISKLVALGGDEPRSLQQPAALLLAAVAVGLRDG